ncbi:trk system potassium uptake protein TrkA [bacterium BMS3Abin10]|nr:trk system potassium uptake protein TrkA [bacterium BMS3Abin10]GBE39529.1 trk system potassium uptake protein TrkA [bacterium BMS3Bbin08]
MLAMRVIVVGSGEVGFQIAKVLSAENVDVVVVDKDKEKLKRITGELDVAVIEGEGGSPSILEEAGAKNADILLAVTDMDETNMIACLVAKAMFQVPRIVARIRNLEYIDNETLLNSLGINPAISPEIELAKAIVRLLEVAFAVDCEDFEAGKVKVIGFKILSNSKFIGKTLKNLGSTSPKILIGAIQRADQIIIPTGNDRIKKDDIIFVPVKVEDVDQVCKVVGGVAEPVKNVMIVGGGRVGFYVAKTLEERDIRVKIIERDTERCKFLLKSLKKSVILHGDGSDQKLLEEENIHDMDVFAAISNNEELNIMASLLAKSLGAKKVITVVNRTDYLPLANSLGIEAVLSPRLITADTILKYVRPGNIISLTTVADGKAEIMEAQVSEDSVLVGKTLVAVELPKKSLIGAIIRGDEVIIPSGLDKISKGDKLIIFTLKESIKQVAKILQ